MKVYIQNLYGIKDGRKSYYRKQGINCFDFVNSKDFASDLTKEETEKILNYAEWYMIQYNADTISVEK